MQTGGRGRLQRRTGTDLEGEAPFGPIVGPFNLGCHGSSTAEAAPLPAGQERHGSEGEEATHDPSPGRGGHDTDVGGPKRTCTDGA